MLEPVPRRPSLRSGAPGDTTLRQSIAVRGGVLATRSTAARRAKGGGGGGSRTRVRETSMSAFYTLSAIFNLT